MMYKITLSLIFVFIVNQSLVSQNKGYGFKGGITITNFTNEIKNTLPGLYLKTDSRISFNAGVFIDIFSNRNFVVSSELYFNRKAGTNTVTIIPAFISSDFTIDYLQYGVSLKYKFNSNNFIPYIFMEPRVNFYLGSNLNDSDVPIIPDSLQGLIKEDFTKFGTGLSAGAGMDIKLSKRIFILIEAQFSPDFFYIYSTENFKIKNNSFEFRTGLKFF